MLTLGRICKFIPHRVVQGGGGGRGVMEPLPSVFDMLQYFKKILPSLESLRSLKKMRYILWVVALLEARDVTNNQ